MLSLLLWQCVFLGGCAAFTTYVGVEDTSEISVKLYLDVLVTVVTLPIRQLQNVSTMAISPNIVVLPERKMLARFTRLFHGLLPFCSLSITSSMAAFPRGLPE